MNDDDTGIRPVHACLECGFTACTCRLRAHDTLRILERHVAALGEASLAVQHAREGWYACVSVDGENYHAGPERSLAQAIDAAIASVWETR